MIEENEYNLKALLKENGISQAAIAKKLGISRQHLHDIVKLNRRSRYADQIYELATQGQANIHALTQKEKTGDHLAHIDAFPVIHLEDLVRLYLNQTSLNLLSKPCYTRCSVINLDEGGMTHFCLRITDLLGENSPYMIMGVFRLYTSLSLRDGLVVILYLSDSQKTIIGKIEKNSDTGEVFVINHKGTYSLNANVLLSECTQMTCQLL